MKKNYFVYHIISNGAVIYVGLTSNPISRLRCHQSCARRKKSALYSFLKNKTFNLQVVSSHEGKMSGSIAEMAMITSLRKDGVFLFNLEAGGLKFKRTKNPEIYALQQSLAKAA